MRTRVIQDPPEPEAAHAGEGEPGATAFACGPCRALGHDAGKLAIWGWIALVHWCFGVVMNAQLIETQRLREAEQVAGEAGQAERALDDAGLNPTEEVALIKSQKLQSTIRPSPHSSPTPRGALKGDRARLEPAVHLRRDLRGQAHRLRSLRGDGRRGGHQDQRRAERRHDRNAPRRQPAVPDRPVRRRQREQGDQRHAQRRRGGRGQALRFRSRSAVLLEALGALVTASIHVILALTSVLATMAVVAIPSQVFPLGAIPKR